MKTIKCEHPVCIFNPHLVWLYCTRAIAVRLGDRLVEVKRSPRDYYNFPWSLFVPYKEIVTQETADDYFLYDADDNAYPVFMYVPCGKCRLCRDERVNEWITRCICESSSSKFPPLFLTLTYDRQHLPADGVSKDDVQLFMKRLRRRVEYNLKETVNLRYFLVAEYGKKTKRAHYHMLLWNMPYVSMRDGDANSFYSLWSFIRDAWQNGFVRVERCRDNSGRYCFKYMRKECQVPEGKNDTFYLASRRRGLGYYWLEEHYKEYYDDLSAVNLSIQSVDTNGMPTVVTRPIPSYFKRQLWPSVSQVFPQRISNALRLFMESASQAFYSQQLLYPDSDRPQRILDMVEDVTKVYGDIFPVDFQAAYPKSSYAAGVSTYLHMRDADNARIPESDMRENYRYVDDRRFLLTLAGDDNYPYLDIRHSMKPCPNDMLVLYKTVEGVLSTAKAYDLRRSFIRSWSDLLSTYIILSSYTFNKAEIKAKLSNAAAHSNTVRLLHENDDPVDIEGAIHKYEVDRRWEATHWLEDRV